jgi:phosphoglycolate phosphatase
VGAPYRLLIFDFDGTLADTFPAFERAVQEAIPRFGMRAVNSEDLARLRGMSAREIIRFLRLPFWKVPRVGKFVRERMAAERLQLFKGVDEILRTLAEAGLTLAFVSSNSETNIRAVLGPELASLFTTFACGASLFGKASRFRQVLKRTGVAPAQTITIGDEIRDAEAAASAGIAFGAVAWGYTEVTALQRSDPAAVFHTPADLLSLLL